MEPETEEVGDDLTNVDGKDANNKEEVGDEEEVGKEEVTPPINSLPSKRGRETNASNSHSQTSEDTPAEKGMSQKKRWKEPGARTGTIPMPSHRAAGFTAVLGASTTMSRQKKRLANRRPMEK